MAGTAPFMHQDKLCDWLKDKPRSWAQVIASRAALRVLPVIGRIIDSRSRGKEDQERLIVAILRANLASTVAFSLQTYKPLAEAASHADASFTSHASNDDADAKAVYPAYVAAAYAANTAYTSDAAYGAAKAANAYAAGSGYVAYDDPNWLLVYDTIWRSVFQDKTWLEARGSASSENGALLFREPLWQGKVPKTLRVAWSKFANSSFAVEHGFQHWIQWYEALASLDNDWHPRQVFSNALALRIATQPDEWWKRSATAVNADIAQWLREETTPSGRPAPLQDIIKALDALPAQQPAPYLFDWRDGRMEVLPPDALPEDGGIAQDYLHETREKADGLLEALARSNTDPTIVRKVGKLREVLTERAADLRPALVDSRSISVERLAKALDNPQDAAEMPARILADLGDLADTARRLCNCLPALWQRDAERLANSLTPDSATALLHHLDALREGIKGANIIGPDVQAAFDTLSEDSAEPDADDVRRRRIAMFGLAARNLLTTLLRASKGAADKLVDYARNAGKEFYPELVKTPAKLTVGTGVNFAAACLVIVLLGATSGIAKFFPEIDRVVRVLEALRTGEGKPTTPPAGTEPPLSPRTPRPTAERGPTRPT